MTDYIQLRPDHLWSQPPKHEEPFSTPRAWHMLSDALHAFGSSPGEPPEAAWLEILAYGCLSPQHASQFNAFVKQRHSQYQLNAILKGESGWPYKPEDRDLLYFLAQSLRAQLIKELPVERTELGGSHRELAHRAKALLKDLAAISLEMAQMVVAEAEDGSTLPPWLMVEIVRGLPQLVKKADAQKAA